MTIELVTLSTADGIALDGAMHVPPSGVRPLDSSILLVHGLGWNFYQGPSRWLPPLLTLAGYRCLALNMRDHTAKQGRDFDLSHHDLRAGIDELERRFGPKLVLFAHGFGCNKVICYPALSGDLRSATIVLATLGAVQAYRPALWKRILRRAAALRGEVLVVQGAVDPAIDGPARANELAAAAPEANVTAETLEGADHYFNDRHEALARRIQGWLAMSPEKLADVLKDHANESRRLGSARGDHGPPR